MTSGNLFAGDFYATGSRATEQQASCDNSYISLSQVTVQRSSAGSFSVISFTCSMFSFFSGLHHPYPPLNAAIAARVSRSESPH